MLNFASQLIAGLISVAVVVIAARWGMKRSGTMLALLAAAVVGAAWSVFSDFTLTYADPVWDRSVQAVIKRALLMAVVATLIGFFVRGRPAKSSD